METDSKKRYIFLSVVVCALVMGFVDGVIQPGYFTKSVIKLFLFALVPSVYFLRYAGAWEEFRALFILKKRDLWKALILASGVYGLLVGGYLLISRFFDLTGMILKLTDQSGVSADNFLWVSLYISFVNSFLEEFLFRGFGFITLKKLTTRHFAYLFSAIAFSVYHFGMIAGAVNIPVWIVAAAGLFIAGIVLDWLNDKSGSMIVSWIVHMFANFGINTVGFIVLGII